MECQKLSLPSSSKWVTLAFLYALASHSDANENLLVNSHFEQGTTGWTFSSGTGLANNNPFLGQHLAFLDPGSDKRIGQSVIVDSAGHYDVSLFASAEASGGQVTLEVDGSLAETIDIDRGQYRPYRSSIYLPAGSHLKISIIGASAGWVNVDTFVVQKSPSTLGIESSSDYLNTAFHWARSTALSYVQSNTDPSHGPSYWGGYPHRQAFYSRDIAHQMLGAHLLGLDEENISMMRIFAESATPERRYYPLWAFGFDGSIYPVDYNHDDDFVRELPAPFELVEKSYEQYLWTADQRWINESVLTQFYRQTVSDFVDNHDSNNNGIADEKGTSIFEGVATYNEQGDHLREAADALGAQYQAYLAYAEILSAAGGDRAEIDYYKRQADTLLTSFRRNWWSGAGRYIRGYDQQWLPVHDWGKENSFFIPLKFLSEPGNKTNHQLDHIDASVDMANDESYTYLPEVFWPHGQIERGWHWLRHYADTRNPYPELSFALVGHVVSLMAGVEPNAPTHGAASLAQLPGDVEWLSVLNLPIGEHLLNINHRGNTITTLTHVAGETDFNWHARFSGVHSQIYVNGVSRSAMTETLPSGVVSYTDISLRSGQTATAQVPGILRHSSNKCVTAGPGPENDSILRLADTCDAYADAFVLLPNLMLRHIATGYCVHPLGGTAGSNVKLVLFDSCTPETRLHIEHTDNFAFRHQSTGMCVHPDGGAENPTSGTPLIFHSGCNEKRLEFSFGD